MRTSRFILTALTTISAFASTTSAMDKFPRFDSQPGAFTLTRNQQEKLQEIETTIQSYNEIDPGGVIRDIQREINNLKAQRNSLLNPLTGTTNGDEAFAVQLHIEQSAKIQEEQPTIGSIQENIQMLKSWDPEGKDRDIQGQIRNLNAQLNSLVNPLVGNMPSITDNDGDLTHQLSEAFSRKISISTPSSEIHEEQQPVKSIDEEVRSLNEFIQTLKSFDPQGKDGETQRQIRNLEAQKNSLLNPLTDNTPPITTNDGALALQLEEQLNTSTIKAVKVEEEQPTAESIGDSIRLLTVLDPDGKDTDIQRQINNLQVQLVEFESGAIPIHYQIQEQNHALKEAERKDRAKFKINDLTLQKRKIEEQLEGLTNQYNIDEGIFNKENEKLITTVGSLKQRIEIIQSRNILVDQRLVTQLSDAEKLLKPKRDEFLQSQQQLLSNLAELTEEKESIQSEIEALQS